MGVECCRLLPLMGGKNVPVSMAPVRLEEEAQHPGIDGSEKQAEVSG